MQLKKAFQMYFLDVQIMFLFLAKCLLTSNKIKINIPIHKVVILTLFRNKTRYQQYMEDHSNPNKNI